MTEPLTSLQNPRVKRAARLRDRRGREEEGLFIIEGFRELTRALDGKLPIAELFHCPEMYLGDKEPALVERARTAGAVITPVVPHVFEKLAYRDRPEGLLAVAPIPSWTLDRLQTPSAAPLYLVAVAIEKPGNLGTILRSADAAGCHGVIVCDRCTDIFNPNVVRASIGTLFTVPVAEASSDDVAKWLRERGIRTIATEPEARASLWETDLRGPVAILIGSEQYGLDARWRAAAEASVSIPMRGAADSLNAATATTVLLYEALRQRSGNAGAKSP